MEFQTESVTGISIKIINSDYITINNINLDIVLAIVARRTFVLLGFSLNDLRCDGIDQTQANVPKRTLILKP